MAEIIPSAIAIPDEAHEQSLPSANGLKRRQSDPLEQEQETKRKRTSLGKNSPRTETRDENGSQAKPEVDSISRSLQKEVPKETRRKTGAGDEKQRSKRLFGALLGNLNQTGDRVSKRRTEIEQRRKAELQKQDDERLEDRQRRLERLATQRKKDQVHVDEQNMHARHKHLLDAANFLYTRTEPRLYYRPWDLLPDEEDRIEDQVKEAQSQIDKEVVEWEEEKRRRLNEFGEPRVEGTDAGKSDGGGAELSVPNERPSDAPSVSMHENPKDIVGRATLAEPGDSMKQVDSPVADAGDLEATTDPQVQNMEKISGDQAARTDAETPNEKLGEESKNDVKVETEVGVEEAKDEARDTAKEDPEDEEGHVEEGDEDTVIY